MSLNRNLIEYYQPDGKVIKTVTFTAPYPITMNAKKLQIDLFCCINSGNLIPNSDSIIIVPVQLDKIQWLAFSKVPETPWELI